MVSKENQFQIAIIEHDVNGDDLCVWQYPSITQNQIILIEKHSTLSMGRKNEDNVITMDSSNFIYFKLKSDWIYMLRNSIKSSNMPDLTGATMICISRLFHPEKYLQFLQVLYGQYMESYGDPTKVLEGYLSVFTTGSFTNNIGCFDMKDMKSSEIEAYSAVSSIRELVQEFAVESVILWNAVLLKKRILVIDDDIQKLLQVVRSLPQLVWHRKDWSILRPILLNDTIHIEDLTSSGVFIAGSNVSNAAAIMASGDMFDVIVNLSDHRINISSSASSTMKMCSVHKDMAKTIIESVTDSASNMDIIKSIHIKTVKIIESLKSLAEDQDGVKRLTEASILSASTNETTQQWLRRLAVAEGLLQLE